MDIRKRLKGLVAMAICLTVLAGMSLPVNAAGMTYQIEDLTSGMVIEAGSTITGTTAANSLGTVKSEKVCKLFSVENDIKLPSSWPSF